MKRLNIRDIFIQVDMPDWETPENFVPKVIAAINSELERSLSYLGAQVFHEVRENCQSCNTPFSEDSINGGRCTNCGSMICAVDAEPID